MDYIIGIVLTPNESGVETPLLSLQKTSKEQIIQVVTLVYKAVKVTIPPAEADAITTALTNYNQIIVEKHLTRLNS